MKRSERAVSRVLCPRSPGAVSIYLGPALLRGTSDLPGSLGRAVLTPSRGTLPYVILLQAGFAKHSRSPGNLVGSCPTVSPLPLCGAVFFSVALSMGSPPVPFRDRLALRSSDFPPPFRGAITSPALIVITTGSSSQCQGTRKSSLPLRPFYSPLAACCLLPATLFSHRSPCSPAHPLPCSVPEECILPRHWRSWQSVP